MKMQEEFCSTPTQAIFHGVLFMYALKNTKKAKIQFLMTKFTVILAILDMASAKPDVNGPKKKGCFWQL